MAKAKYKVYKVLLKKGLFRREEFRFFGKENAVDFARKAIRTGYWVKIREK